MKNLIDKLLTIIIITLICMFFSACSIASFYNTSKTIYLKNKEVVVDNFDSLDKDTQDKLISLDNSAKLIDSNINNVKIIVNTTKEIENLIKEEIELSKKNIEKK